MRDEDRVKLWDAINAYAITCGGDPSRFVYGNTPRQKAVAEIETLARAVAQAARDEVLGETGSTVVKACAALVRLTAPDDVDEHYVPRAAVVDIALGLDRDMKAIRSRSAAGEQGRGGGK